MLEPEELRLLTYAAIGHGVKGITYFDYGQPGKKTYANTVYGFANSPPLVAEIQKLNREIKTLEPLLSVAFSMSIETVGAPENGIRVYTLWSGEAGMLVIVRNLDYTTNRINNDLGAKPAFRSRPKPSVDISIKKPSWLTLRSVVDPLDKNTAVSHKIEGDTIQISCGNLALVKTIWIENDLSKANPRS